MKPGKLEEGDVVQLSPETCRNKMLAGCFLTVTEPKSFGAQGYVQALGANGEPGGMAFYRAGWDEMEFIGKAVWMLHNRGDDDVPGDFEPVESRH